VTLRRNTLQSFKSTPNGSIHDIVKILVVYGSRDEYRSQGKRIAGKISFFFFYFIMNFIF